jgi:purine-nucleoside phosphorylase
MIEQFDRQAFVEAAAHIRARSSYRPSIALVLGSGLNPLAEQIEQPDVLPFEEIPHFPSATVEGHQGRLILGTLAGATILVMQGRAHYYEGYSMQRVTFPIRVMRQLGMDTLILTNAAGGVNPTFRAGDLMLITDHINLVGMAGLNPLRGPNDPELGPRFLDMSKTYDADLRRLALRVVARLDIPLHQGVYICLAGPTFETPADIRFLHLIGADAVGMSTVPEAIVARHGGMRVLGISGISNVAIAEADSEGEASHEEVLEAGRVLVPRLTSLLNGILTELSIQERQ